MPLGDGRSRAEERGGVDMMEHKIAQRQNEVNSKQSGACVVWGHIEEQGKLKGGGGEYGRGDFYCYFLHPCCDRHDVIFRPKNK